MNRKEFIKICGLLGLSLPLQSVMSSCNKDDLEPINNQSIIIVGAGVAGMVAGYLLTQKGINCEIIEASPSYGGRIKTTNTFVDFPIPLGAEWLHSSVSELSNMINNPSKQISTQLKIKLDILKMEIYLLAQYFQTLEAILKIKNLSILLG